MEGDPGAVLRVLIPEDRRQDIPYEVQDILLQKFEFEGELEVFYQDFEDGSHRLKHFLKTDDGNRFALHFGINHLMTGGARFADSQAGLTLTTFWTTSQ